MALSTVNVSSIVGHAEDADLNDYTAGTNDTAAIQAWLDATSGPFRLYFDQSAKVNGIKVPGGFYDPTSGVGSELRFAAGKGLIHGRQEVGGVKKHLVRNANPRAYPLAAVDTRIGIVGGELHGWPELGIDETGIDNNGDAFMNTVGFFGVEDLTLDGITFKEQSCYTVAIANNKRTTCRDLVLDGNWYNMSVGCFDGLHFFGGTEDAVCQRITCKSLGSDSICFNSSDYLEASLDGKHDWVASHGPINNVLVEDCVLARSDPDNLSTANGIGILSLTQQVTNITIRRLSGTVKDYGFSIWNPWPGANTGFVDNILLDDCAFVLGYNAADIMYRTYETLCFMFLGENWLAGVGVLPPNIGRLTVRNIQWTNSDVSTGGSGKAVPYIMSSAPIQNLAVSGVQVSEPVEHGQVDEDLDPDGYIALLRNHSYGNAAGAIDRLTLTNANWDRVSEAAAANYWIQNTGTITQLRKRRLVGPKLAGVVIGTAPTQTVNLRDTLLGMDDGMLGLGM